MAASVAETSHMAAICRNKQFQWGFMGKQMVVCIPSYFNKEMSFQRNDASSLQKIDYRVMQLAWEDSLKVLQYASFTKNPRY